jgi:uncharacterized repeat protein (TIGR03803 family)
MTSRSTILALAAVLALATVQPAQAQTYSVLYTFTGGADGGAPFANVILDSSGNIYGTTQRGGDPICSCGVVFKVDPTGHETVLHTFVGTDGSTPVAALIFDPQGNLYGATTQGSAGGSGNVFKITPSGTFKILQSFRGLSDGGEPQGLAIDAAGNLYGSNKSGGSQNCDFGCGTLFRLGPPAKLTILHTFLGGTLDGSAPVGAPYLDAQGNIRGTTLNGGLSAEGTQEGSVYQYSRNGVYTRQFLTEDPGPRNPQGGMVKGVTADFFVPSNGGQIGDGTVFRVNASNIVTGSFSFTGTDGQNPNGGLVIDGSGNIYGTTYAGGANGWGSVFEINASGETVLYSFNQEGQNPAAGVAVDAAGNIYGTTFHGGSTANYGVVFKITP